METHRAHLKTKLNLRNGIQLVQFSHQWVRDNKLALG